MSSVKRNEHLQKLYRFAEEQGFTEDLFLSEDTVSSFISTTVDAFSEYPMFLYVFKNNYDKKTFSRMLNVDFKSRMDTLAGIASGKEFESVVMIESPEAGKPQMGEYIRVADLSSLMLLFNSALHRLETFEKAAMKKRAAYMDDRTWYLYIFATKHSARGLGHGKKLMRLLCSYADETKSRICLETNLKKNVPLYEHFGFHTKEQDVYKKSFSHFVMLYDGATDHP